ncbi:MAG: hypothetical protein BWY78_00788 [Alphaproteobacteria bacterium ADurb.Bin438]|nr:MAG: hypothetical protein BWY78_00788 [Alphaproteobacteria bacterium ADurb.Bin438]
MDFKGLDERYATKLDTEKNIRAIRLVKESDIEKVAGDMPDGFIRADYFLIKQGEEALAIVEARGSKISSAYGINRQALSEDAIQSVSDFAEKKGLSFDKDNSLKNAKNERDKQEKSNKFAMAQDKLKNDGLDTYLSDGMKVDAVSFSELPKLRREGFDLSHSFDGAIRDLKAKYYVMKDNKGELKVGFSIKNGEIRSCRAKDDALPSLEDAKKMVEFADKNNLKFNKSSDMVSLVEKGEKSSADKNANLMRQAQIRKIQVY